MIVYSRDMFNKQLSTGTMENKPPISIHGWNGYDYFKRLNIQYNRIRDILETEMSMFVNASFGREVRRRWIGRRVGSKGS